MYILTYCGRSTAVDTRGYRGQKANTVYLVSDLYCRYAVAFGIEKDSSFGVFIVTL